MMNIVSSNIILPTITVAISTIAENMDRFLNHFSFESLRDADEVLIIIQGTLDHKPMKLPSKYIIIEDNGKGVSRSRNLGLSYAKYDYIWFMDDDIQLNNDAIITVKNYILKYNADIFTVRMQNFDSDAPYKNYPNKHLLGRRDIINISTVEIIASRGFILDSKVRFNESLGLGTKYPSCEENIFLLDLLDIGAEIIHVPEYVQKHPLVNRRRMHFTDPNILFAKGVFCNRYSGFMGMILIFLWMCKSLICGASFKDAINLVYGYNSADNILNNV